MGLLGKEILYEVPFCNFVYFLFSQLVLHYYKVQYGRWLNLEPIAVNVEKKQGNELTLFNLVKKRRLTTNPINPNKNK